jgi:hypothetical protein
MDVGVQTELLHEVQYVDRGIQANPVLTINTQNVSSPILQTIDVRDAFISVDLLDKSTQTLLNKLDQGIQTINGSGLEVPSVNLIDFSESPVSSVPPDTTSRLNKFNLELDLNQVDMSLVEMSPNEIIQMGLLDSGIDFSLTEAYIPIPELAVYS